MPAVKIELSKGRDKQTLLRLRDSVMDSVVETLKLPSNDRNIRLIEHKPEFFQMKPPYEILIEISMFLGRTKETKKKLYQTIVEKLEMNCSIEREKIFIILNEQPLENWGGRGGIPADEMDLGFRVNV
ncbi:MAG: tautomerase family protein [Dysgonamonadaceae bacterium]|jgi:phenylpyruvate tautomerase PptA (4-oxalocrotonate tautomerase family)|nr:tautomerase family protein [Dysgonamonadaceae bacterium]